MSCFILSGVKLPPPESAPCSSGLGDAVFRNKPSRRLWNEKKKAEKEEKWEHKLYAHREAVAPRVSATFRFIVHTHAKKQPDSHQELIHGD